VTGRVGPRRWKGDLHEGEPVEYVGSDADEWLSPGDLGTLITPGEVGDPPPSWVVSFENTTEVIGSSDLRPVKLDFELRMIDPDADRARITEFLVERSTARVARLGELVAATAQAALVAEKEGRIVGVLTYIVDDDSCEVLTLHVAEQWHGIGSALLREIEWVARDAGCHRLWLITTNDNLDALRFYQRRGFQLANLHAGGIIRDRKLKPEIPAIGEYGIFINDELELHKRL
jgi:GNAT superfamily N-acetyltransferase